MLNHPFLASISQSLCQICISSTSEASRRTQIMLSIFTVSRGLGGFWLDLICVNLLVLSTLSSLWYASEIRQWYYCKRIDLPRGKGWIDRERERVREGGRNTHKDGNMLTQIGPHAPQKTSGPGSESGKEMERGRHTSKWKQKPRACDENNWIEREGDKETFLTMRKKNWTD